MRKNQWMLIACIVTALTCLLGALVDLEAAVLTVGSSSGMPGEKNILIPINLSSSPSEEVCSFNLDLNFDISRLTFKSVTLGLKAVEAGKSLSYSRPDPKVVRVIVIGFNPNIIGNGVVLHFTFDILGCAPSGKGELIITKPSLSDPNAKLLPVAVKNGSITVEGSTPLTTTSTVKPHITTTVNLTTSTTIPEPPPDSTTTTTATINSTTSTTPLSSTTTTTKSEILWPLLYNKIWKENQDNNLFLLRSFRNEVLSNTELGQEYLFMLYSNSIEILILLLQDPVAVALASEVADGCLRGIESLLYKNEMVIDRETADAFEALLTQLEPKASPALKTAITRIQEDNNKGRVFKRLGVGIIK